MSRLKGWGVRDRSHVFLCILKHADARPACIMNLRCFHQQVFLVGQWPRIEEGLNLLERFPTDSKAQCRFLLKSQSLGLHAYGVETVTRVTLAMDPVERVASDDYHLELHSFPTKKFELKIRSQGPSFRNELNRFQEAQRVRPQPKLERRELQPWGTGTPAQRGRRWR